MILCYHRVGGLNMNFVYDNYIWFIVIGVILFMALIGYIAEKTNFGRNQFEKKVKKEPRPKKEKKPKEPLQVEEVVPPVSSEEETPLESGVVIEDDDWMNPLEETTETIEDDLNEELKEDFTVPLELEQEVEEEPIEPLESKEEDLTVPFGDSQVEPIIDTVEEPIVNESPTDINPVNIDNIIEPNEGSTPSEIEEDSEESAWKF